MKADIIVDGGSTYAVEVKEADGRYLVRIRDSETDTVEEISVDFDASASGINLLIDNQSYPVELCEEGGHYRGAVHQHRMEAQVRTPEDKLRGLLNNSLGAGQDSVETGMPGAVLEVFVKAGDQVAEGDKLAILEAMKMENTIRAPRAAVIASVNVSKGENIQAGHTILTFEAHQ